MYEKMSLPSDPERSLREYDDVLNWSCVPLGAATVARGMAPVDP